MRKPTHEAAATGARKVEAASAASSEQAPYCASTVVVAIPCLNEAAAIEAVIKNWRAAAPEAEIVVFDNDSTDGTGALARKMGVRVVPVPERGKGNAVRAMFERLADCEIVVMTDGDGTYPAGMVHDLLAPILDGRADMTVGARRPVAETGSMTPVRRVGNVLIRAAFRVMIGRGGGDLLSGYRAFNRRFREAVELRSSGFEIETELAAQAVARRLRLVEVPIPYYPRISGTTSKLRAFRDGRRILATILTQAIRFRPRRVLALAVATLAVTMGGAVLVRIGLGN
jgi:glycosyltransferase involved in cell wall biosynthesis